MKYKSLLVRIPPDIHDALTRLRTQRHVNTSAWVRAAIKTALEGEGMLIDMAVAQPKPSRLPRLSWMLRSQAGGPTASTTGTGAPSTSAIPPRCPLSSSVQTSSCRRETASPGPPP